MQLLQENKTCYIKQYRENAMKFPFHSIFRFVLKAC